jgi:predicted nuclease of restriction endonuclease-like (RecB) superfamily
VSKQRKAVAKRVKVADYREFPAYGDLVGGIAEVLETARRTSIRTVNAVMTATYWEIGRRIVEYEQGGKERAEYGEATLAQLSRDLTNRYGRGFGADNLQRFRLFYVAYPSEEIYATASRKSLAPPPIEKYATLPRISGGEQTLQTPSAISPLTQIAARFPLPWSAYVRLLAVKNENARTFYETEALRAGWSVRQLDRQIQSQFYERTALSRNKAEMLTRGARPQPDDAMSPEEEIKDPYVLEFLGLRDEYSETDLEAALIHHLEAFLLELGGDFCFIGRQRRLRIGDEWYRVDLVFYHRRLRCLVLIDLKLGRFTHADAGQMHTYLSYAAEHWTRSDENPPVGLILCARKDDALARYALGNLPNKVLAAEYRTVLPDETLIAADLQKTRRMLERRGIAERGTAMKSRR